VLGRIGIKYYPFEIKKVLTDNGGEFTNKMHYKYKKQNTQDNNKNNDNNNNNKTIKPKLHLFDKICKEYKIEHRLTKPYTPKTNGMVERFNKKIQENIIDIIRFKSIKDLEKTIYQYIYNYNHYIKHSGINRLTPIEKLKEYYKQNNTNKNNQTEIKFTKSFNEFIDYDKLMFEYSVGLDTK